MTTRELPQTEWVRLAGTELGPVRQLLDPATTRILVVEDERGEIVGCWSVLQIRHVEGLWIRDDHRDKGAVGRRLLAGMRRWLRDDHIPAVLTSALTPEIADYLEQTGATMVPGLSYYWPVEKE